MCMKHVEIVFLVVIFSAVSENRKLPLLNDLDVLPWQLDILDPPASVETCDSAGCHRAAKALRKSINTSVDPCDDFYEFSCGGWMAKHPVPPTQSHWNQFDVIERQLDHQLKDIFEEPENSEDPAPVNWAKMLYRACMDIESIETAGVHPLANLLDEFGGWPIATKNWNEKEFSWQKTLAASTRRFAVSPLVAIYVYLDRKDSNRSVITVDQSTLVLPRGMLAEPAPYGKQLRAYAEWIAKCAKEIARANGQPISMTKLHVDANDIVEFEIELAKLTSPSEERRDSYRMYNAMSIRQLQKWTDAASSDQEKSVIDWHTLLGDVFSDTDIELSSGERLLVREVDFIVKLVKLLEGTPPRTVANYVLWRMVRYLGRETTQTMRELSFQFDKVFSGIKEDQPRWRDCVSRTNNGMMFAAGYKYVKRQFDNEAKKSAMTMVKHIREAFKSRVDEAGWMDAATREAAREKADVMTEFIGFPDWYGNSTALADYYHGLVVGERHFNNIEATTNFQIRRVFNKLRQPTDRTEWLSGPAVVNAYYNPLTNSITFPAGILQAPFFAKDRIEALNYGSIGVVIGHEITHGFDDMGRQSDKIGNLAQWWSDATISAYVTLASCFVEQYDNFRVPQLDELLNYEVTMNGVTTQGENMADNGGVRQAFLAYQHHVQKHGPEPRLPGLKYTPEQLFFLGFSTVWCESSTPESLLTEVLSDPHAPHRFRVLGPLINSPEFSAAWNCPRGSPMNSDHKKCRIW